MKCPGCGFVCSDTRDLCSKCFLDLRACKRELGLPISSPNETYAELLARLGHRPKSSSLKGGPDKPLLHRIWGSLGKLAKAQSQAAAEPSPAAAAAPTASAMPPAEEAPPEAAISASMAKIKPLQTPPVMPKEPAPAPPTTWTLPDSSEELDKILDEIIGDTKIEYEPTKLHQHAAYEPASGAFEFSLDLSEQEPASLPETTTPEIPPTAASDAAQSGPPGDDQTGAAPPPLGPASALLECDSVLTPAIEPAMEIMEPQAGSHMVQDISVPTSAAPADDNGDMAAAFEMALAELEPLKEAQGFELSAAQMRAPCPPEEMRLFFDAAEASLADPDLDLASRKALELSATRQLDAGALEQQLRQAERTFNAQWINLKGSQPTKSAAPRLDARAAEAPAIMISPPVKRRIVSFLIDTVHVAIWAMVLGMIFVWCFEPAFKARLFAPGDWSLPAFISFLSIFLAALPPAAAMYLAFRLLLYTQTSGEVWTGLIVVDPSGEKLPVDRALIRSACLLPSVCMAGALPVLKGRRPLHDWLAGTRLVKKQ